MTTSMVATFLTATNMMNKAKEVADQPNPCGEIQLALHEHCQLRDEPEWMSWFKNWKELPEIQRAWHEAYPLSKESNVQRREAPRGVQPHL
jgi:hypothetical protein